MGNVALFHFTSQGGDKYTLIWVYFAHWKKNLLPSHNHSEPLSTCGFPTSNGRPILKTKVMTKRRIRLNAFPPINQVFSVLSVYLKALQLIFGNQPIIFSDSRQL